MNIIIPDEDCETINALWTIIAPAGDAEARSFGGVPLSANGQEPVTHRGISTSATEEMRVLVQEIFVDELAGAVVSMQDYRENDWNELLSARGLQTIEMELP